MLSGLSGDGGAVHGHAALGPLEQGGSDLGGVVASELGGAGEQRTIEGVDRSGVEVQHFARRRLQTLQYRLAIALGPIAR